MTASNRLKYASFPVLFLNFLMLLTPVLLILFTIQVTPLPAFAADAYPSVIDQFMYEHLKERLALSYGGEQNIPPLSWRAKYGYQPTPTPAGEDTIIRDSMLYFLPDDIRLPARRAWSRAARFLWEGPSGPDSPRTPPCGRHSCRPQLPRSAKASSRRGAACCAHEILNRSPVPLESMEMEMGQGSGMGAACCAPTVRKPPRGPA